MKERQELVNKEEVMSIRKQCEVLSVDRSGLYYFSGWGIGRKPGDQAQDIRVLFGSSCGKSSSCPRFPVHTGFCGQS